MICSHSTWTLVALIYWGSIVSNLWPSWFRSQWPLLVPHHVYFNVRKSSLSSKLFIFSAEPTLETNAETSTSTQPMPAKFPPQQTGTLYVEDFAWRDPSNAVVSRFRNFLTPNFQQSRAIITTSSTKSRLIQLPAGLHVLQFLTLTPNTFTVSVSATKVWMRFLKWAC